jgi:hypothetical protein
VIGPINADGSSPGYIYSTSVADMGHVVVDHRGYPFAPVDGQYTITIELEDNIVEIWLSTYAYSGWTKANENFASEYYNIYRGLC